MQLKVKNLKKNGISIYLLLYYFWLLLALVALCIFAFSIYITLKLNVPQCDNLTCLVICLLIGLGAPALVLVTPFTILAFSIFPVVFVVMPFFFAIFDKTWNRKGQVFLLSVGAVCCVIYYFYFTKAFLPLTVFAIDFITPMVETFFSELFLLFF